MTTTLLQTADAAFPDRPADGGVGLRVAMAPGDGGARLAYPLPHAMSTLHARFALRIEDAAGGKLMPLRGLAGDAAALELIVDPDANAVDARAGDASLATPLPASIPWPVVEVGYDLHAARLTLSVNGRLLAEAPLPPGSPAIDAVEFGAPFREAQCVGEVDLDELVLADAPVGPVVRPPVGDHADDPARWLVLYRADDGDSLAWAADYRRRRGVPLANLLAVDAPHVETIDLSSALLIRDAVDAYLDATGLGGQVMGVLCGHGLPGCFIAADGSVEPLTGLLQAPDPAAPWQANPLFADDPGARPASGGLGGARLAARIDGPTLADSVALTTRALAIEAQPLDTDGSASLWLDPVAPGDARRSVQDAMLQWASGLDAQALRLPIETAYPTDPPGEIGFNEVRGDAFYWGWAEPDPPEGFFADPPGRRVFAAHFDDTGATASNVRAAGGAGWARAALDAGYAAAAGTTDATTVSALPRVAPFFEALRRGWTLAEAWATATPLMRGRLVLVGDPLMRAPTPKAGFDVLRADLDAATPMLQLIARVGPEGTSLEAPEAMQPAGRPARFVVRRIDEQGTVDGVDRSVDVEAVGAGFAPAAAPALWPRSTGWAPTRREASVEVVCLWARRFADGDVASVDIEAEPADGEAAVVASVTPNPTDRIVSFDLPEPTEPTRYRPVARTVGGATWAGPWSRRLRPAAPGDDPLTPLEV